jgi:hypothetical protein
MGQRFLSVEILFLIVRAPRILMISQGHRLLPGSGGLKKAGPAEGFLYSYAVIFMFMIFAFPDLHNRTEQNAWDYRID